MTPREDGVTNGCRPEGNRAEVEVVSTSDLLPGNVVWGEDGSPRIIGNHGLRVALSMPDGSDSKFYATWEPADAPKPPAPVEPAKGEARDEVAECEAFAAHMKKRHAYEYVYWNGADQPSAKRPSTPYGEGWVPVDEQWAAWQARAAITHPAAASAESIRAEVIEECAREALNANIAPDVPDYERRLALFVAEKIAAAIRALSARATKEVDRA